MTTDGKVYICVLATFKLPEAKMSDLTDKQIEDLCKILGTKTVKDKNLNREQVNILIDAYINSEDPNVSNKGKIAEEYLKNVFEREKISASADIFKKESIESKLFPEKINGKILNNTFRIVNVINEGGEAVLYKAEIIADRDYMRIKEVGVGDFVAIREYKKPEDNIQKGIKALSETKSKKNIVKYIHDFDEGGIKYLVTEFIDGYDLRTINKRLLRNITPEEAAVIAYNLGIALKEIHESEMIHCDVNDKNIMIAKNGEQKLIDFGLVHYAGEGRREKLIGTIYYLSPQQIVGDVDYRTDIYAIGPLLFELLTGKRLFDDKEEDVEKKINNIKDKIIKGVKPSDVKDYLCNVNSHKTKDAFLYDIIIKTLNTAKVKGNKKVPVVDEQGYKNIHHFLIDCRKLLKMYNVAYVLGEPNPEAPELEVPLPKPKELYDLKNSVCRKIVNGITLPRLRWNHTNYTNTFI